MQTGTVSVIPVDNGCAGVPLTFTATVQPVPVLNPVPNVTIAGFGPIRARFEADAALEHGVVRVNRAHMRSSLGTAVVSGFAYDLLHPSADFALNLDVSLQELSKLVKLPAQTAGQASFAGKVSLGLDKSFRYDLQGLVKGRSISMRQGRFAIRLI